MVVKRIEIRRGLYESWAGVQRKVTKIETDGTGCPVRVFWEGFGEAGVADAQRFADWAHRRVEQPSK